MRSKSTLDWGLTSTLEQVTTDLRRAGKPGRSISFVGRILKKGVLACLFIQANGGSGPRGRFSEYRLGPAGNSSSPSLFAVDLKILRVCRDSARMNVRRGLGVGVEGYHPRPFGMRGGCTIPPWPRFPRPPDNPGRPNFSRSGLEPWPILREPSQTPRGLSADSHTPQPNFHPRLAIKL